MNTLRLRAIKPSDWPRRDRELWEAAREPDIDSCDAGVAAEWSVATIKNCEFFYGQYLRYLELTDRLDPSASPLARTDVPLLREFIAVYRPGHAETSLGQLLVSVAFLVRACHPPAGNPALTELAYRLQGRAKRIMPKASRMASLAELIDLGERLMEEGSERLRAGIDRGAIEYRDGLMIAMLAALPMRRKNFAQLQIGHSIFITPDSVRVEISGCDTKNRWEIERSYPDFLVPYVAHYCSEIRGAITKETTKTDNGYLWIGQCGGKLWAESIYRAVRSRTLEHLGRGVPVHLFRDSVATDVAVNDPKHVGITRVILGHRTYSTTEKYYTLAQSAQAFARYDEAIEKRRKKRNLRELLDRGQNDDSE